MIFVSPHYLAPVLASFLFSGTRPTGLHVGFTKVTLNFGSVDRFQIIPGSFRCFIQEHFISASETFGLSPFLDYWASSVWYYLYDDFRNRVAGNEYGSLSTIMLRFLYVNDAARQQPTQRLHMFLRLPAGAKSERPLCFGPVLHATLRPNHVWETWLADKLIWNGVNDAWAKDQRERKPEYRKGISNLIRGRIESGLIVVTRSEASGALLEAKARKGQWAPDKGRQVVS